MYVHLAEYCMYQVVIILWGMAYWPLSEGSPFNVGLKNYELFKKIEVVK